jgi:hypothetical protein
MKAGDRDPRLDSDAAKLARKDITKVRLLEHSSSIVAFKLVAMGASPLLADTRGFDGLSGPQGAYLSLLGGTAYMPATLDKALAEMGMLNVAEAAWDAYAGWSYRIVKGFSQDGDRPWSQAIIYVDATQDPYWTRQFALSGKVSRVNKVMPCISRAAVSGGAGPPILIETVPGSLSLKTRLFPLLQRVEKVTGEQIGRLTIIDAEMCTVEIIAQFTAMEPKRYYVTVLKGALAEKANVVAIGEAVSYRERDVLQEGEVQLTGSKGAATVKSRTVSMCRPDSRNPQTTIFLTNAPAEILSTAEVADSYLSRWPHQEQYFRDTRNGGGLNHSHGFGGEYVNHVALTTTLEHCNNSVARAAVEVEEKTEVHRQLAAVEERTGPIVQATAVAKQQEKEAEKRLADARQTYREKNSMPREIYKRDVTRDSIATVAKMLVMMLCEFAMQQYFNETQRMMYRTFITQYMQVPVTVITSHDKIVFRLLANTRSPDRTHALRLACAEITRRQLRRDRRLMIYEVVEPVAQDQ